MGVGMSHVELDYKFEFAVGKFSQWRMDEVVLSNTFNHHGVCWQLGMSKVADPDTMGAERLQCFLQMVKSGDQKPKLARICLLSGTRLSSEPTEFKKSGDKSTPVTFVCKPNETEIKLGVEVFKFLEDLNPTPAKPEMSTVALNWFKTEEFGDVTIVAADGIKFRCHRDILSARSEVFHLMFSSGMKESRENLVNIDGYEGEIVTQLLVFIYTNACEIGPIADRLYAAAHQYEIERLKEFCESALFTNVSAENVVRTYRLARFYHLDDLSARCVDFLNSNKAELPIGDIFIEAMRIEEGNEAEKEQK